MLILVADDDRLARFTLKSMLRDLDDSRLMICEAANGKTLVEQCRRRQPDIAFVDIDMPQMDGLTAIEQCKRYSADTQFVVVTGYSDFEYARKGIALQIADYIVKPIDPAQLESLMSGLVQRVAHTRRTLNMDFQMKVSQSYQLWEEIGYCETEDPCAGQGGMYYAFSFFIDARPNGLSYPDAYLALTEGLNALGRVCAERRIRSVLRDSRGAALDFIVHCEAEALPPLKKQLERLCYGAAVDFTSVSCLYASALDLWQLFQDSSAVAQQDYLRFGVSSGQVLTPWELPFTDNEREFLAAIGELTAAFQEADESRYAKSLARLKALPADTVQSLDTRRLVGLLGIGLDGRFSWDSLPQLCRQLSAHKSHIYSSPSPARSGKVTYATDYMEKHYMQDISVMQLAEKLEMTPNYFSKLFHERTGQTFSAYLTTLRVRQAKRILLTRQDVLVKDVALMVGYFSSRHFASVFKKMTGFYPSDFRESGRAQ